MKPKNLLIARSLFIIPLLSGIAFAPAHGQQAADLSKLSPEAQQKLQKEIDGSIANKATKDNGGANKGALDLSKIPEEKRKEIQERISKAMSGRPGRPGYSPNNPLRKGDYGSYTSEEKCVQWQYFHDGPVCVRININVTIQPRPSEVGMPGGFGIGAEVGNQYLARWSRLEGWKAYTGGVSPLADGYFQALPKSVTYTIYDGPPDGKCAPSEGSPYTVYAGYGVLTPENVDMVENYHRVANPRINPDQLRAMYIQMNGTEKGMGRYAEVLSVSCAGARFDGN